MRGRLTCSSFLPWRFCSACSPNRGGSRPDWSASSTASRPTRAARGAQVNSGSHCPVEALRRPRRTGGAGGRGREGVRPQRQAALRLDAVRHVRVHKKVHARPRCSSPRKRTGKVSGPDRHKVQAQPCEIAYSGVSSTSVWPSSSSRTNSSDAVSNGSSAPPYRAGRAACDNVGCAGG